MSDPAFPRRAIGVFSYTDTTLEPVEVDRPLYGFRRFRARRGDLTFQVVAVWTAATEVRARSYMQAHEGIVEYGEWIRQQPTVILGDFNDNASYGTIHWGQLLKLTNPLGLVSAYHTFFGEPFGAESRPTFFRKEMTARHLDYCFIPTAWAPHVIDVTVGEIAREEDGRPVSDHAPLIVDVNL